MKIATFSDVHAHNFQDYSKTLFVKWDETSLRYKEVEEDAEDLTIKPMNSRLFFILQGLCDMRDYCLKYNIQECLFGGDLFHKRSTIDVTVFNAMYRVLNSFKQLDITVHGIAGNHDQTDSSIIPTTALHSLSKIMHVIEQPELFQLKDDTEVVALPYSKDKQFIINSMNNLRDQCQDPKSAILLCHLGLSGGVVGSGMYAMNDEYTLQDLMYDKWKYLVAGHYHQPQLLAHNSFYCGTPVQNNFGDERKGEGDERYNGFFVIDTSKRWDIQFVPVIAPRFITVSSAQELEELGAEVIKNNYVRVKSSAEHASELSDKVTELLGDDTKEVRLELEKDYSVDHRSDVSVTQTYADSVKTYAKERWNNETTLGQATDLGLEILAEAMNGGTK